MGQVAHICWLISAIKFNYGVVYAVRDRFQQVKVRSRSGLKRSNFEVDIFHQKGVFLVYFNLRDQMVPFDVFVECLKPLQIACDCEVI